MTRCAGLLKQLSLWQFLVHFLGTWFTAERWIHMATFTKRKSRSFAFFCRESLVNHTPFLFMSLRCSFDTGKHNVLCSTPWGTACASAISPSLHSGCLHLQFQSCSQILEDASPCSTLLTVINSFSLQYSITVINSYQHHLRFTDLQLRLKKWMVF